MAGWAWCIRSVWQVLADLASEANGVHTVNQFGAIKFDDIEWPLGSSAGKKGFVRMAIRKYKVEHGA